MTLTAKIFKSGNSQAVRLPKQFRFDGQEVEIFRRGQEVVLRPKGHHLEDVFEIFAGFSDDFMAQGRCQPPNQTRDAW